MIRVNHLFGPLDKTLIEFLQSLHDDEWNLPTSAGNWTVRDVASHLLDGNLRTLSLQRDRYFATTPPESDRYEDLVKWLNKQNATWIKAAQRLSPGVLRELLEMTGPRVTEYYASLPLKDTAIFPVAWAGESESLNWMHLAREYTEKWHHQQQIREIRNDDLLLKTPFFDPYVKTSLLGLPWLFRDQAASEGTALCFEVFGECTVKSWLLRKQSSWLLAETHDQAPDSLVKVPAAIGWKLFSRNIRYPECSDEIIIEGDMKLGRKALELVAVMA